MKEHFNTIFQLVISFFDQVNYLGVVKLCVVFRYCLQHHNLVHSPFEVSVRI